MRRKLGWWWLAGVLCCAAAWGQGLPLGDVLLDAEAGLSGSAHSDRPVPLSVTLNPLADGQGVLEVRSLHDYTDQLLAVRPVSFKAHHQQQVKLVVPASHRAGPAAEAGFGVRLKFGRQSIETQAHYTVTPTLVVVVARPGTAPAGWIDSLRRVTVDSNEDGLGRNRTISVAAYASDLAPPATLAPADALIVDSGGADSAQWLNRTDTERWVRRGGRLVVFDADTAPCLPWLGGLTSGQKRFGDGTVLVTKRPRNPDRAELERLAGLSYRLQPGRPAAGTLRSLALSMAGFDKPATWLFCLFVLGYVFVLVPLQHTLLQRRRRRELAWVVTPALVLAFTGGAYVVGVSSHRHHAEASTATMVFARAGDSQGQAQSSTALYAPRALRGDVTLPAGTWSVRESESGDSNRGLRGAGYDGDGVEDSYGHAVPVTSDERGWRLSDFELHTWSTRTLGYSYPLDLGGAVEMKLTLDDLRVRGTITNHLPYTLRQPVLLVQGNTTALSGDVAPGQQISVDTVAGGGAGTGPNVAATLDLAWSGSQAPLAVRRTMAQNHGTMLRSSSLVRTPEPLHAALLAWVERDNCPLGTRWHNARRQELVGLQVDAALTPVDGRLTNLALPVLREGVAIRLRFDATPPNDRKETAWVVRLPRPVGLTRPLCLILTAKSGDGSGRLWNAGQQSWQPIEDATVTLRNAATYADADGIVHFTGGGQWQAVVQTAR